MCQPIFLAIKCQKKPQKSEPKISNEVFKLSNLWIIFFYFVILKSTSGRCTLLQQPSLQSKNPLKSVVFNMPGYTATLNHLCSTHSNKWSPNVKQFNLLSPGDLTDACIYCVHKNLARQRQFSSNTSIFCTLLACRSLSQGSGPASD